MYTQKQQHSNKITEKKTSNFKPVLDSDALPGKRTVWCWRCGVDACAVLLPSAERTAVLHFGHVQMIHVFQRGKNDCSAPGREVGLHAVAVHGQARQNVELAAIGPFPGLVAKTLAANPQTIQLATSIPRAWWYMLVAPYRNRCCYVTVKNRKKTPPKKPTTTDRKGRQKQPSGRHAKKNQTRGLHRLSTGPAQALLPPRRRRWSACSSRDPAVARSPAGHCRGGQRSAAWTHRTLQTPRASHLQPTASRTARQPHRSSPSRWPTTTKRRDVEARQPQNKLQATATTAAAAFLINAWLVRPQVKSMWLVIFIESHDANVVCCRSCRVSELGCCCPGARRRCGNDARRGKVLFPL